MKLLDRIFSHPALRDDPPIFVDIGASGGTHPVWRKIARYAIGVGFEPDGRERSALSPAQREFRRWILCDKLVVADENVSETEFYFTSSPFCSSTLLPDGDGLREWAFAPLFNRVETRRLPATTLKRTLQKLGFPRIDWLKCDTQGTDLRIFQSLGDSIRDQVLAVEFEPGLVGAYKDEEKLHHVLAAMEEGSHYWLAKLEVQGSPRGNIDMLRRHLGSFVANRYPRFGPQAPICANATYLKEVTAEAPLGVRESLLLCAISLELNQPAFACDVAEKAALLHGDAIFRDLLNESTKRMRRSVRAAVFRRCCEKICGF